MKLHAPSALLAGAVLSFGAIAFANLYLPGGQPPALPAPSEAPLVSMPISRPSAPVPQAPAAAVASPAALPLTQSAPPAAPLERSQESALVADTAQTASGPNRQAAPTVAIAPPQITPAPVLSPQEAPPVDPRDAAGKAPSAPKGGRSTRTRRASVHAPVHQVKRKAVHAERRPRFVVSLPPPRDRNALVRSGKKVLEGGAAPKFSLSAVSGSNAWIRIGNRRTVVVHPGAEVPGLGQVTAVGPNSVTFSSGRILKGAP